MFSSFLSVKDFPPVFHLLNVVNAFTCLDPASKGCRSPQKANESSVLIGFLALIRSHQVGN